MADTSARAQSYSGSYSGPSYSGGKHYAPGPGGIFTNLDDSSTGSGWGGGSGGTNDATCSGPIQTIFTWLAPDGTLPPQSVIITETSSATASGASYPASTVGGSCDDGIGQSSGSLKQTPIMSGTTQIGTSGAKTCQGTRYSTMSGGQTVTLNCTPTASASAITTATSSVTYSASASAVTISPGGAIQDSSGNWNILVGQQCKPTLSGIPGGCIASNYQWSVTGTTFQSWVGGSTQTTEVDGPGPLNGPNASVSPPIPFPGWYWNDANNTTETISCTATVTPPAGEGSAFTVTVTQKVNVWIPVWAGRGVGGEMLVGTAQVGRNGTDECLYAAPEPDSGEPGGMSWYATVSPPVATVTFGAGQLELVQLVIPGMGYTNNRNESYTLSNNGQEGLDTSCPYGWESLQPPTYTAFDEPGLDLTSTQAISAYVIEQFEDYLMYEPPGNGSYGSQWVPLGHFVWSTDGDATIPSTGNWADFGQYNLAGTIDPSGSGVPFASSNTFPSWTQNSGNNTGTFQQ